MEEEKVCYRVHVWWPKGGKEWLNFHEAGDAYQLYLWVRDETKWCVSFGPYRDTGFEIFWDFEEAKEHMILKKLEEEKGDGDRAAFGTSPAGLLLREESV